MPLSQLIQMLIHKLEIGAGSRYIWLVALSLTILAMGGWYDFHSTRNFSSQEAMDSAQLARNISEGKGYTTVFIRPFSLYLVQAYNEAKTSGALTNADFDFAQIKTAHPDIANAPVYPVVLAGLMKVLPFHYPVELNKPFWSDGGK